MIRRLILTLLALTAACATAQTVTSTNTLSWVAPTTNVDGSAITGSIAYNVYQGAKGGTFAKTASALTGTSTTVTTTAGTCFAVTTVAEGSESAPSATACLLQPSGPTSTSVSVTITVK